MVAGGLHAEYQDEEGVDLHVEAGAERRGGAGAPGDVPVHPVQDEGQDDQADRLPCAWSTQLHVERDLCRQADQHADKIEADVQEEHVLVEL